MTLGDLSEFALSECSFFCDNFGICRPILIILSLFYSEINCRRMKLKLNLSHGLKLVAELHRVFTARGVLISRCWLMGVTAFQQTTKEKFDSRTAKHVINLMWAAEKRGGALWRVKIYHIKPYLVMLREVEKWLQIRINADILITSRGSPLAHAYHVWSTNVNAFVSYPAHMIDRQNERQTNRRSNKLS